MYQSIIRIIAVMLLAVLLAACMKEEAETEQAGQSESSAEPRKRVVKGECMTIHEAEICTWAKVKGDQLIAFGATVPVAMAENAPLDEEMVFPPITLARIPVPAVVSDETGVDHLGVNWEVQGHPPGTFFTPHYDFHFYTQSGEEIEAIDCTDHSKPEVLPDAYVLPDITIPNMGTLVGLCVPAMGMHAVLGSEMEATELFGATMIVGYYQQKTIFTEPMISRATLLARESFKLDVPALSTPGEFPSWPVAFKAIFDEEADAYYLSYMMDK